MSEFEIFTCEYCEIDYTTGSHWLDECYCQSCYFKLFMCDCPAGEYWPHRSVDHNGDCYFPPPCGGCYNCLNMQLAYYDNEVGNE